MEIPAKSTAQTVKGDGMGASAQGRNSEAVGLSQSLDPAQARRGRPKAQRNPAPAGPELKYVCHNNLHLRPMGGNCDDQTLVQNDQYLDRKMKEQAIEPAMLGGVE